MSRIQLLLSAVTIHCLHAQLLNLTKFILIGESECCVYMNAKQVRFNIA